MVALPDSDSMMDPKTPSDVEIRFEARKPMLDPTLGISVTVNKIGNPKNRLVAIGDSLTHGFQSGAVFQTNFSYPAIVAREMGWGEFRYPVYDGPGDGLPLNLEFLANRLEGKFGDKVGWLDFLPAVLFSRNLMGQNEDYWERQQDKFYSPKGKINHNLAVYGWDLRNTLSRHVGMCLDVLEKDKAKDDFWRQVPSNHNERAAIRVLNTARDGNGKPLTPIQAAAVLGAEGSGETEGIETLVVMIGANNALGSILTFNVAWSGEGYDDMSVNDKYTVWRPIHFRAEFDLMVAEIKKIRARHVIISTVPHITIAPFARGVGDKARKRSRYFPYYTLPWIEDKDFNPDKHPRITENETRAIDSAIDQYNDHITEVVKQARLEGRDWYLLESAGILDRLASRRYIEDPTARPSWWDEVGGEYKLPPEVQALTPFPTSEMFESGAQGRIRGGLFSLDGIHPTTIGYGILAQEVLNIMDKAGVKFYEKDGKTERNGEIKVDFRRLVAEDTLISKTPRNVTKLFQLVGGIDKRFNLLSGLLKRNY
jgi:hypothetical protein